MPEAELLLRSAYRAFNARDIEAAIELMHPEVDWPNAWEGGRLLGRAAVRDYWTRQFASISGNVEPEGFTEDSDGSVTVDVQTVWAVGDMLIDGNKAKLTTADPPTSTLSIESADPSTRAYSVDGRPISVP